jgi:hypothetical protein
MRCGFLSSIFLLYSLKYHYQKSTQRLGSNFYNRYELTLQFLFSEFSPHFAVLTHPFASIKNKSFKCAARHLKKSRTPTTFDWFIERLL